MRRELDEEVIIDTPYTEHCVGLINDDETPVGRVHSGRRTPVRRRRSPTCGRARPKSSQPGFSRSKNCWPTCDGFETWSQICLQALFGDGHRAE